MAYPDLYDPTYSYTAFQQAQGDNSFPGTQLDADLAGLAQSDTDLATFVEQVIRSDGKLANSSVDFDQLTTGVKAGLGNVVAIQAIIDAAAAAAASASSASGSAASAIASAATATAQAGIATTSATSALNSSTAAAASAASIVAAGIAAAGTVTAATTQSRTALSTDIGKLVKRSNAGGAPNNNMQDTLPGGGSALPAGMYTFKNVDTAGIFALLVGAGSTLNGISAAYLTAGPGQVLVVRSDGTNYESVIVPVRTRVAPGTTATLYVQATGSNSNAGVLSTFPKAGRQFIYDEYYQSYDLGAARLIIQHTGNFTDTGTVLRGRAPGTGNSGATTPYAHAVHFIGDAATPSNCVITASSGDCFTAINNASYHIDGFKLVSTSGNGVNVAYGAVVGIGHIEYGVCGQYHIKVGFGPGVHFDNSYTVSGGALSHIFAYSRGSIENQGGAVVATMVGTPAFSGGVFAAQSGGLIAANGLSVSGNVNAASPAYAIGPYGGDILVGSFGTDLNTLVPNAAPGTFTGNAGSANGLNAPATFTVLAATTTLGYAAGAGGTVTQATSKATGVTLNKASGQITMNAAALAAGVTVLFTLTNSTIAATDIVLVQVKGGFATTNTYSARAEGASAGSCTIAVANISAGSLSEAVVLNFIVIKGVNA